MVMFRVFYLGGAEYQAARRHLGISELTWADWAEEIRTRAHKRALSSLIVDAIAEQEKIEVSDDELAARVAHIVTRSSGRERDRVAEHYRSEEHRAFLRQAMRREKTLDLLLTRAQSEIQDAAGEAPSDAQA